MSAAASASASAGAGASGSGSTPDRKAALLDALEVLQKKELASKQPFKAAAYAKVRKQLSLLPAIRTIDDVRDVTGIGEKIHAKIEELLATGVLAAAERAKAAPSFDAYDIFLQIHGVGPAKARALVDAGYTTLADLRAAATADPKLLNKSQRIGLQYYEALQLRIPRAEMEQHAARLAALAKLSTHEIHLVGSYRRGAVTSGDIDVLLRNEDPSEINAFVDALKASGYLLEVLALGDKKCMGICRLGPDSPPRRIDILRTPLSEFGYAHLYFTGPDEFNVAMRRHALTLGLSLNEHALTRMDTGAKLRISPTERSIFDELGLQFKEPTERAAGASAVKPV